MLSVRNCVVAIQYKQRCIALLAFNIYS